MDGFGWLPIAALVATFALGIATIVVDGRAQRAYARWRGTAARARAAFVAPGGNGAPIADPPPASAAPFIAAGTVIAFGVYLSTHAIVSTSLTDQPCDIAGCRLRAQTTAVTKTIAQVSLVLQRAPARAPSLTIDGTSDAVAEQVYRNASGGSTTYTWFVTTAAGIHTAVIAMSDDGTGAATVVKHGATRTTPRPVPISGGCGTMTLPESASGGFEIAVALPRCTSALGTERVYVDGREATKIGTMRTIDGPVVTRYYAPATTHDALVDVIVPSPVQTIVATFAMTGSDAAPNLDDLATFLERVFGLISTLGGLLSAVIVAFRRSPPAAA